VRKKLAVGSRQQAVGEGMRHEEEVGSRHLAAYRKGMRKKLVVGSDKSMGLR